MLTNATNGAVWRGLVLAALVLAGACRAPPERGAAATTGGPNASQSQHTAATQLAQADAWPVDPERTVVNIIVRRAGPLARLGHDHVITSADERGNVWIGPTPAVSAFELELPVDRFDVDLPGPRAAAGAEFAAPVPDDARAGTRQNMLRKEVLDAAGFPVITVRSTAASGDWPQPVIRLSVTLRGATREFEIPVSIERDANGVVARGEVRFNQTDFGITPFSVAGGAIQVADTLEVRFEIAAHAP
jgi:polyisoprenoid-binding protein YceI